MKLLYLSVPPAEGVEFTNELKTHDIKFNLPYAKSATPAPEMVVEIISVVGNAAFWGALASVLVSFIKTRSQKKMLITLNSGEVIQAEGFTEKELEKIISNAKNIRIGKN